MMGAIMAAFGGPDIPADVVKILGSLTENPAVFNDAAEDVETVIAVLKEVEKQWTQS